METRFVRSNLRATPAKAFANSPGTLTGYAAKFSAKGEGPANISEDLGGWRERVSRTAFDKSLRSKLDVKANINHDPSYLLGRTATGSLRLSTDSIGLRMSLDLPDTSYARDLYALVQRSDMDQMSFAFTLDSDGDCWDDEEGCDPEDRFKICTVRTLRNVRLLDVSCVTNPAYPSSSVFISSDLTPRSLPDSCPLEMRSQILSERNYSNAARAARQRLFAIVVS